VKIARQIATILTLSISLLVGIWTGVFFLTAWLYRVLDFAPPLLLVQIINSLLGVCLFCLLLAAFFWILSRSAIRDRQGLFEQIIEAMGRIAKGDFQVRLNLDVRANMFTSELAQSVNQMAQELDQMEHLRQEFISNVSHEIQSPLTSIRGFAQALHNEHLQAEERQHYLSIIEAESTRLSRITDNMLKLATLEAEHDRIEMKPYRLDKQIRVLILSSEPQWMRKAIEMDVALDEVVIVANEDLLSQVWSNLLHNSIKFTPDGGCVRVEVRHQDNGIECRVIDTGIGIPEEAQARIFERFYKDDSSRERAHGGSGLGLAIARKIVELHRGTIRVESQPGRGTVMIVSLPAN
jgi:two-component system phosphate regulon sensor histidine kinase PhoR